MNAKILIPFLFLLLFANNIFPQLGFRVTTNKPSYQYGETIFIYCTVTNNSDTTIRILAPYFNSCQAEFKFNNFYSRIWTSCLATSEELIFPPRSSIKYSWKIDPKIFGFPSQDGIQKIIGTYFLEHLRDTIFINAPMFLGGELNVGFPSSTASSLLQLKDSLNVLVTSRAVLPETIYETWQIIGFHIDTVHRQLSRDNRLLWADYNRTTMYDSIIVTKVKDEEPIIALYFLSEAYPNPFNSTARFYFEIPKTEIVRIALYNIMGEKIAIIFDGLIEGNSRKSFEIDGANLSSGTYFYVVASPNFYESKKIILLK